MIPSVDDTRLAEMVRRLVEVYRPERIYLFGSVARGDAGPDSDYDLMVVVPDDAPADLRDCRKGYEALRQIPGAGVHVLTRQGFNDQLHLKASFPSTIVREGRLLFVTEDPVQIRNTREWLIKAHRRIRSAQALLGAPSPIVENALFSCQQAADTALRAFLTWHDRPFTKAHELKQLSSECASIDPTLAPLLERAESLSKYAWLFRYPGAPYEPTLEEAQQSLALAREVLDAIRSRLPAAPV